MNIKTYPFNLTMFTPRIVDNVIMNIRGDLLCDKCVKLFSSHRDIDRYRWLRGLEIRRRRVYN